ncbi:MAG: cytochrome c family protein, partial [Melioribacteraceae bacterium]|nr:cytochrome c family protein [Melioribacteraceae bacterium]
MKKISIIILVFISASIYAQKELEQHPMAKSLECNYCHSCEIPTKDDPCLYTCPRTHMVTLQHPVEDAPEVIVLDELKEQSDLYAPVVFSHRLHAEMSNMAGGCQLCHHYNPPGVILGCQECHENSRSRTDLNKPDLKGAYHRQCIDCHREWTHEVECASCHLLNEKIVADEVQVKDYSEIKHPKIIEPTKIVYNTEFDDGDIVTFYHDEHVNLFNVDCSSCHLNSSCASSHDTTPFKLESTLDQLHRVCSEC